MDARQQISCRRRKGGLDLRPAGMGNREGWAHGANGLNLTGELRHRGAVYISSGRSAHLMASRALVLGAARHAHSRTLRESITDEHRGNHHNQ